MKANELRLNNLVEPMPNYVKVYGDFPAIITTIYQDKFIVSNHYPGTWFQPIPLTEEWLVKFGLSAKNYSGHNAFHIINTWEIGNIFINQYDWGFKTDFLRDCDIELKHVHQLQNLYFALTGEELKIKI